MKDRARTLDWSALDLPLPRPTARRIAAARRRPAEGDNVGLWLDKLVYRDRQDWSQKDDRRVFALEAFCGERRSPAGAEALARSREATAAIHGPRLRRFRGRVTARLLVDYGRANTAETTASFHHVWGLPRIPGSALKGATRAWMEMNSTAPARLLELFGDLSRAGLLAFYDAAPADGVFALALDVLTPHHRAYYDGDEPPTDWQSPVPHTFLDVVDTEFEFCLALERRARKDGQPHDNATESDAERRVLDEAKDACQQALSEAGVGAKTSAGYGRFGAWTNVDGRSTR